jgi:hypothetical protein
VAAADLVRLAVQRDDAAVDRPVRRVRDKADQFFARRRSSMSPIRISSRAEVISMRATSPKRSTRAVPR